LLVVAAQARQWGTLISLKKTLIPLIFFKSSAKISLISVISVQKNAGLSS